MDKSAIETTRTSIKDAVSFAVGDHQKYYRELYALILELREELNHKKNK